jgi:hypothetical protein
MDEVILEKQAFTLSRICLLFEAVAISLWLGLQADWALNAFAAYAIVISAISAIILAVSILGKLPKVPKQKYSPLLDIWRAVSISALIYGQQYMLASILVAAYSADLITKWRVYSKVKP